MTLEASSEVSVICGHLLVGLVDDAGGDHPGQDADDGLLGLFGQRPPPFELV